MKRTEQQQQTISAPLGNILVSAAAGSGKTSVMTERIVSRILAGQLDMRNVLVMTFTDAAAKNMRDKIERRLRDALAEEQTWNSQVKHQSLSEIAPSDQPAVSERQPIIRKQIAYLEQSSISTIHAFCLDVIRNFYYEATDEAGKVLLEPGFRIEEQGETKIFLEQALDDLFERYYAQCDQDPDAASTKDFLLLVDAYGSTRDDIPVRSLLLSFYPFLRSMPDYEEWIARQKAALNRTIRDFDGSPCRAALFDGLRRRFVKTEEGMAELDVFLSAQPCLYSDEPKNRKKNQEMQETLQGFSRFMKEAARMVKDPKVGWDALYSFFQDRPCIPNLRHHPSETPEKAEWIDLFESSFAEFLHYTTGEFGTPKYAAQFLFEKVFIFDRTQEEITRELAAMRPAIFRFLDILLDLDREYARAKREANMIDFADFEHFALRILKVPLVKQYYLDKFKEIYVDEYQDTSSIQEAILERISKGNCFMVGDVKQSIYKFRHARPKIFRGKYAAFVRAGETADDGKDVGTVDETAAGIATGAADEAIKGTSDGRIAGMTDGTDDERKDAGNPDCGTVFELNRNFRSVKGILNAVNDVFYQIMSEDAGEIDYNTDQSLVPHREDLPDVPAPVEVFLVDLSEDETGEQEASSADLLLQGSTAGGDLDAAALLTVCPEGTSDMDTEPAEELQEEETADRSVEKNETPEEAPLSKEEATRYQKEAAAVALRIKELLEESRKNSFEQRLEKRLLENFEKTRKESMEESRQKVLEDQLEPGKIAVLARTRTLCAVFAESIGLLGIPVEQEQREAFLDRYELKVMEALLMVLDNPMQDIPLASVMRAPLFELGFGEEELLDIRSLDPSRPYFYECCESYADHGSDPMLKEKVSRFYRWIAHLREGLAYQSIGELIETVYTETDFLSVAAKMPDGLQRVRSLHQFQDWAGGYDRSRRSGLYSFVRYMEAFHEKSQDQSPFGIEQSRSNSVKVMTIHKSKGLEYDIVFLVGNNRKMAPRDARDPILVSEEWGIGFQYVDVERQFRYPTPLIFAMREGMRNAELAEEMRLLYVGMTRAMGRIFITGTCNSADNREGKGLAALIGKAREYPCCLPLPPYVALSAKSTIEWIALTIARNPHIDFEPLGVSSYTPEGETDAQSSENLSILAEIQTGEKKGLKKTSAGKVCTYSDSWGLQVANHREVGQKYQEALERLVVPVDHKSVLDGELGNQSDEAVEEQYRIRFLQEYPYGQATHSPLKITVSEIKRREQEQLLDATQFSFPISPVAPPFRSINTTMEDLNRSRNATETMGTNDIGIAVHSFFRFMDLDLLMGCPDRQMIEAQLDRMLEEGMVQKQEHACLSAYIDAFEGFLGSGLASRLLAAYKRSPASVFREIPFTIKMDCRGFFGGQGFADSDKLFVQGMIDCWFVEDGEAVLVDYKTDRISGSGEEIKRLLQERYRRQLSIYAEAITQTTGLKVKESMIWLVDNKKEFIIEQ